MKKFITSISVLSLILVSGASFASNNNKSNCDSCIGKYFETDINQPEYPKKLLTCENKYGLTLHKGKGESFNNSGYWFGEVTKNKENLIEVTVSQYGVGVPNSGCKSCLKNDLLSSEQLQLMIDGFPSELQLYFPSLSTQVTGKVKDTRLGYTGGIDELTLEFKVIPESGVFLVGEKGIVTNTINEVTVYKNTIKLNVNNKLTRPILITNIGNNDTLESWAYVDYNRSGSILVSEHSKTKNASKVCMSVDTWGD
ncbi:MAG: hypothetical protein GY787_12505 [Alteromonadales bacterium]|nr:hypothetical protein [Alteromonadales bacterium]